jgi:hypothetical protein
MSGWLDVQVFNGAVFGTAGTVFLDEKLMQELEKQRISASSIDRYTTVVMAGIAAEALTFKNAEGGGESYQRAGRGRALGRRAEGSGAEALWLLNSPWGCFGWSVHGVLTIRDPRCFEYGRSGLGPSPVVSTLCRGL